MKHLALLFLCLVTINFIAYGQRVVVGKVVDIETKKPIKEAEVQIEGGTNIITKSNALGYFQLTLDSVNTIFITSPGYETGKVKVPDSVTNFQAGLTRLVPQNDSTMFVVVENPAQYPGGIGALAKYLKSNLKMPKEAKEARIKGKVVAEFIIDKTGVIPPESIKIIQSLLPSCDKEVVRIIKGFPRWIPGMQNNRPVRSKFVLPIWFNYSGIH